MPAILENMQLKGDVGRGHRGGKGQAVLHRDGVILICMEDKGRRRVRPDLLLAGEERQVGIISHVAALKDRIDRQVVVHKERSGGSWVEIVT